MENTEKTNSSVSIKIPREIIMLVLALVVSGAVMYYGVSSLYRESEIIGMEMEFKKENIQSKKLLLSTVSKLVEERNRLNEDNMEKINSLVSHKNNYEDYLAHIVKLANSKNVSIKRLSVSSVPKSSKAEENKGEEFNEGKIDMSALSGFSNFTSFLQSIENGIPFIQEESMSISGKAANTEVEDGKTGIDNNPILDYEVSFKFYHL